MREDIAAQFLLFLLNKFDVSEHSLGLEALSKLESGRSVQVESGQRDKLENESVVRQLIFV